MKGVAGLPPIVIQGAFAALVILGILVGSTGAVNDFVKKQALEINADRIETTALSMNSMQNSSMEMDLAEYEIRKEKRNISLRYRDEEAERRIEGETGFEKLEGPDEWTKVEEGAICLKSKSDEIFNVSAGAC